MTDLTPYLHAPFVRHLGLELLAVREGVCETALQIGEVHRQQDGFVHGGVQATLADHTAGMAAATRLGDEERVLTVEFKLNFLRPARGERLFCRAEVLRGGQNLSVVEATVYDGEALVAKGLFTLVTVPKVQGR